MRVPRENHVWRVPVCVRERKMESHSKILSSISLVCKPRFEQLNFEWCVCFAQNRQWMAYVWKKKKRCRSNESNEIICDVAMTKKLLYIIIYTLFFFMCFPLMCCQFNYDCMSHNFAVKEHIFNICNNQNVLLKNEALQLKVKTLYTRCNHCSKGASDFEAVVTIQHEIIIKFHILIFYSFVIWRHFNVHFLYCCWLFLQ